MVMNLFKRGVTMNEMKNFELDTKFQKLELEIAGLKVDIQILKDQARIVSKTEVERCRLNDSPFASLLMVPKKYPLSAVVEQILQHLKLEPTTVPAIPETPESMTLTPVKGARNVRK